MHSVTEDRCSEAYEGQAKRVATVFIPIVLALLSKLAVSPVSFDASWLEGFHHPLGGADHLLAMIAVGMWAAQLRGMALCLFPLTFVAIMSLGGIVGTIAPLPLAVDVITGLSCLVLMGLVAQRTQLGRLGNLGLIAVCAFFHGYAHGEEISSSTEVASYIFGFVTATLLLHGAGMALTRLGLVALLLTALPTLQAKDIQAEGTAIDDAAKAETKVRKELKSKRADTPPGQVVELQELTVTGRANNLLGIAGSASQGEVGQAQFEYRPLSRNGELVEVVPGAVATQHSGSGKANQYFLRGFNLDHGTDFTTYVDGIPMNMPTHAHGQGYMDLNSIIPELINKIDYGKGPYFAEVGDFSAAGYAQMHSMNRLAQALLKLSGGEFNYFRTVLANSSRLGSGDLLYAGEFNSYNGVWETPEDSRKFNALLRYTVNTDNRGMAIDAKAYSNHWTATNQIPQSAIDSGQLGLYGTMNPTDGGKSNRYSLSANLWNQGKDWKNQANIYALYYDVNLWSDFTGFLDNPLQGDQIHQFEHRVQTGAQLEHTRYGKLMGFDSDHTLGLQFRHDEIMNLGLDHSLARSYLSTVSHYEVGETSVGAYYKNQTVWHDKLRTIAGVRGDFFNNDVTETDNNTHNPAVNAANSGHRGQVLVSPKLSIVLGPWFDTEFFLNGGYGYHSNDARGTTLRLDPNDGTALDGNSARITPMAKSKGAEIGIRSNYVPGLNTTLAFWWLQSSQELVFTGDAGTTEVNGASDRYGVEWTNYYKPTEWLTLDADFALTTARYSKTPEGETDNHIPNSVGRVISAGATAVAPNGFFASLRLRHFGDVPLDPSGHFWANSTSIVNFSAGYKQERYKFEVDMFNLFNSTASDIAYAYDYTYPQGTAPQTGILRHPVEPRMVRATLSLYF